MIKPLCLLLANEASPGEAPGFGRAALLHRRRRGLSHPMVVTLPLTRLYPHRQIAAFIRVWKDRLIARLGPDEGEAALRGPHVRAFDITGKPMRNWVAVEPEGVEDDDQLKAWVERATKFVKTLPRK